MSKIYFIDHESIKKSAKIIKKENPSHNYTLILDLITQSLGYKSYNEYEHYLTNAILNQSNDLKILAPLTKEYINDLIKLSDLILDNLAKNNIHASKVQFIESIIQSKVKSFKEHKTLNFTATLYYLPFIFDYNFNVYALHLKNFRGLYESIIFSDDTLKLKENLFTLFNIMRDYYFKSPYVIFDNFTHKVDHNKILEIKELANNDLKARGLYYAALSVIDDFKYEESLLTQLILDEHDNEFILNELIYISQTLYTNMQESDNYKNDIPIFVKKETKKDDYNEFIPYIKDNITPQKTLILGKTHNNDSIAIDSKHILGNILIMGKPGSGKSVLAETIEFNALCHGRGYIKLNANINEYESITSKSQYLSYLFNKEDDHFLLKNNTNLNKGFEAINANKIISWHLNGNVQRNGVGYNEIVMQCEKNLDNFLANLSQFYFSSKFRAKKFPYYIIIEEPISDLSFESLRNIKKLNSIGIYIVYLSQVVPQDYILKVFKHILIPNGEIYERIEGVNKISFDNCPPHKELIFNYGPTIDGVGFSHIMDGKFQNQFICKPNMKYTYDYIKEVQATRK